MLRSLESKPWSIVLFLFAFLVCNGIFGFYLSDADGHALPVFSSFRLATAHLFASAPLALLVAFRLRNHWQPPRFSFIFVAAFTLLLPIALDSVSWVLLQTDSGFLLRCFVRSSISVSLTFAWIVTVPRAISWAPRNAWCWAFLLWFVFPSVYAWKQSENFRDEFDASLVGMRIARAFHALERFVEIAGPAEYQGKALGDWRHKLRLEITRAEKSIFVLKSKGMSQEDRLELAMQLLTLSRAAEAEQVLSNARSTDPQVRLLLAISAREQKDYEKAELRCRELLADAGTSEGDGHPLVFQLLGESLVGQRKILAAIQAYELAILRCELHRGEFEMRLGTLLGEAGDISRAIEHFNRASQADPKTAQESIKRIRGLQNSSCKL